MSIKGKLVVFIMFSVSLLTFSYSIFASMNFYPDQVKEKFADSSLKDDQLRNVIFNLLQNPHIRNRGAADTLTEKCSGDKDCYFQKSLEYKMAKSYMFGQVDLKVDDNHQYYIDDVYCGKRITDDDFHGKNSIGPMKRPDGAILNCEHTWPQKSFTSKFSIVMQTGDLHHLYPSYSKANSKRSSYHFGEVIYDKFPIGECSDSSLGDPVENGRGADKYGTVFEPPAYHKGNVARSMFYFAVRYNQKIGPTEEATLKKWNEDDPVDDAEIQRNALIYTIQNNRNPFIDYPELVDRISDF